VDRPIRVLLADDHTVVRQGIAEMLTTDEIIEVVGEAGNGAEAVVLAEELKPDVVLLDIEMPVMGAEEAIVQILEVSPHSRVVILTMYDEPRLVREFTAIGASAYLTKGVTREELISVVHAVTRDEDRVVLSISRNTVDRLEGTAKPPLTRRELEILLLVARGMTNTQIASDFHISEGTVKRHLANINRKLGVFSRGEAARKALLEGWITSRDLAK
jgi:DNA-binding NarL/FixJ family response regulator